MAASRLDVSGSNIDIDDIISKLIPLIKRLQSDN
jgi:hypothetical protein